MSAGEHCIVGPPRSLAECRKKWLNQGGFVLLFCINPYPAPGGKMPPSPLLPLYLQKLRDTTMHLWGIVIVMGSEGYLLPKFCHISTGNVKKNGMETGSTFWEISEKWYARFLADCT